MNNWLRKLPIQGTHSEWQSVNQCSDSLEIEGGKCHLDNTTTDRYYINLVFYTLRRLGFA